MPLINCEKIPSWSKKYVISSATGKTDTKLYVPPVNSDGKINWNKCQSKVPTEIQNWYLDYLIDPSFQGVNILFVLSLEKEYDRKVYKGYYLPKL